jgi:hypothetical protein
MAKGKSVKAKSSPPEKAQRTQKKRPKPTVPQPALRPYEPRPAPPIRGLLPVPPEVAKQVAREGKERPMTEEARQMVMRNFLLYHYFYGHEVAYRETTRGVEVLAMGGDEIGRLFKKLPREQHRGIVIGHLFL